MMFCLFQRTLLVLCAATVPEPAEPAPPPPSLALATAAAAPARRLQQRIEGLLHQRASLPVELLDQPGHDALLVSLAVKAVHLYRHGARTRVRS